MDKQDKKGEFSIRTNFIKWLNIQGLDSALFILGYNYTGKSTICHLTKRVIDNYQDPNLKLVQKKKDFEYEYEGELSPKSTRPFTIYPKLYRIEATKTNIIQVPSTIYLAQKKMPNLYKMLNLVGLVHSARKAKFLFCVDCKKTAGDVKHWKNSLLFVFEQLNYRFLNQTTWNSIGFVITKTPGDHNKQIYLSRLPDIHKVFDQYRNRDLYINLLKTIETNKRIEVFSKISTEEGASKDIKEIQKLSRQLSYSSLIIPKGQIQMQKNQMITINSVELAKEEETLYNKFQESLELILTFLAQLFNKLFSSSGHVDIKTFLQERQNDFQIIIEKIPSDEEKLQEHQGSFLIAKYTQLKKISTLNNNFYQEPLGRASLFLEYKERIQNNKESSYNTLTNLLAVLAEHGLILEEFESQLKPIFTQLIIFSIFQQRFGRLITNINFKSLLETKKVTYEFRQLHENFVKDNFIDSNFSSQETPENSKRILNILDRFFPQNQIKGSKYEEKVSLIKNIMMLSSFDTRYPEKGLPEIYSLLQEFINIKKLPEEIYSKKLPNPAQQIELLNKLALLVAQMLKIYGRPDLCAQIFKDCGQYYSAKVCLQIKLKQARDSGQRVDLQVIKTTLMSYLNLLMEMSLSQKALECCFQYAQIYKQLASELLKKMKQIRDNQNKPFSQQFERRFTRKGLELIDFYKNKELLEKIRCIVAEIKK